MPEQRTSFGGALDCAPPGWPIRDWRTAIEADGKTFVSAEALVEGPLESATGIRLSFAHVGLQWDIRWEWDEPGGTVLLESTLTNRSGRAVALGKVYLLWAAGAVHVGASHEDLVVLPLTGTISDRYVSRLSDPDAPRTSRVKAQFFNRAESKALQVGFVTVHRANTVVDFDYRADEGLCDVRAYCDFAGWELPAGQSTPTETLAVMVGDCPFEQLERWADLAGRRCGARIREKPALGWVGWTWVDAFTVERYEDVVLRNAEAVRRRLGAFGFEYVWVSLGNLEEITPGNWLKWNYDLFPSGPKSLAGRLGEMGFRLGLWCGPFWIGQVLEAMAREYGDALLKDADGDPQVVRAEWSYGESSRFPLKDRPGMLALDPTHPKTLALLREVFATYREWGVRYYMIDFLEAGCGNIGKWPHHHRYDKRVVPGPEAYIRALRVIREAAGDDTYLLSSSGPTIHNVGIVDAARTGCDFGEGRPIVPESGFYPATCAINARKVWTGPLRALRNQASAYYTHRRLYLNDSGNVLTVDKPLAFNEARIHATIHAMSGGPTMLGDDIDRIDEERLATIKKTLPRSRDVAFPVDLFDAPAPDYPKVFHRKIEKPWGRFDVVAVYNFGDDLLRQDVDLTRLGLRADADYLVWEFWDSRFEGRARGTLSAVVPPIAVRVYRLTEDVGRPVVVGTDMHVIMGEVEIERCDWDESSRTLSGTAVRPTGERGNVFVRAPAGLRVVDPAGYWIAKEPEENSLVIRAALDFAEGRAGWSLTFDEIGPVLGVGQVDLR